MTAHGRAAARITFQGVSKSFGDLQALTDVSFDIPAGRIVAFLGESGAGKTTAMNVLAGFFLRAESFYNVATEIEHLDAEPSIAPPVIDSYGGVSLHQQSYGQAFTSLIMNRFGGKGLYFLDEPEAALSPTRQLSFISRMHELVEDASQFVIATHSPIIMAYPNAQIYLLTDDGIGKVAYEDCDHFRVTRNFLSNREKMLQILMGK